MWPVERARKAHEDRSLYTVLIDSVSHPSAFIELNGSFAGVSFLDSKLREFLAYEFRETEPGKLFLAMATYRMFAGDMDKVISGTSYFFKKDGHATIRKQSFIPPTLEQAETLTGISGNYEAYPPFGEYEDLLVLERSIVKIRRVVIMSLIRMIWRNFYW